MKNIFTYTVALLFAFTIMLNAQEKMEHKEHKMHDKMEMDLSSFDKNMDGHVYQCTMCKDQVNDKPGKCSECGMKLKEVSVNKSSEEMDHNKMEHMAMMDTGKIWNKYCPVRGEEVDPETPTVDYNGKKIGFCCPGCDKKFNKDPEKYMKNLSEDGQEFQKQK